MTTISNLPFTRFVMQVSTAPQIKSNWHAMQAANLEALKSPVWREVATKDASLIDHDFTKSSHFGDIYDAFQMTGNYDSTAMTEVAYAGMVAYRFKLPDDYYTGSANITSISVPVYRDRFCRGGVRVAVLFDGQTPPVSWTWDYVRGDSGAMSSKTKRALMAQDTVPYLTASSAADVVAEFTEIPPFQTKSRYLWIMLTMEDYEDGWAMYNAKEKRLYAIEGSARLGGDMLAVEFDADVTPDGAAHEYAVIRGGVAPKLPEGSASGARALELFKTGDKIESRYSYSVADYTKTILRIGSDTIELSGQSSDVYWVTPYSYGGVTRNLVAVCGNFDEASIPGVPGLVIFDCDNKTILRMSFSSSYGQIAHNAASLFRSLSSKVGVTVVFVDTVPHAYVWVSDGSNVTIAPAIDIDLSTNTAYRWSSNGGSSDSDVSLATIPSGSKAYTFYDYNVIIAAYSEFSDEDPWDVAPLLWGDTRYLHSFIPSYLAHESRDTVAECFSNTLSSVSARYAGGALGWCYVDLVCTTSGVVREGLNSNQNPPSAIGTFVELKFRLEYVRSSAGGPYIWRKTEEWIGRSPAVSLNDLKIFRESTAASSSYLFYWQSQQAIDNRLCFAARYDSGASLAAIDTAGLPPISMSNVGDLVCCATPASAGNQMYFYQDDIPAEPSAANSALGLRTLQGRFYLGEAEAVARQTRERMGAAYSVRAGTRTLSVVSGGTVQDTSVPVWRMFASAFVVPFALPMDWRAKTLRLDWTGWTGTATAGAKFNVWLRAGHWQDACPQVLESDIPYDALKAEADGWMLLGRVDATLSGANRTASFDLAGRIGSAKVASLMLTAYAPTEGINPDANTAWPVGVAKEVDVVDGEVVNAGKAWLPNVTLIG